ncbi:LLM class flavin-dependent oxidoreductase [Paenibacillus naphthalenovorans]|uniref:LLM class flavin-dependent oxidoreductase n=1 Tax=Paenibacillus naphthalenovorans TaxID=162209 RepID=UPI000880F268|nr:LLM class flavin-dependent oxidoreductase [Paenibacillus naphthalenovorans]GCL72254.1 LLM class flavin-dependent oxidoreductase [Paenibacillus naphthalenovorans]SDI94666.1 alkanesulfonate monooxygenase [Paenibacillus naphthalenovorans]
MSNQQKEIQFGWFLPTAGDGKYVGVAPERKPTLDYLIQVAQAAEHAGFGFVLIPTGGACMDAWVVGSAVMSHTKTLRPLVAVRPGLTAPVLAARMAAALDILSEGRAMINVVTGSSVQDLEELGDPLAHAHDERYERAREYLEVMTRAWTQSGGLSASEFTRSNIGSDPERQQQPFVGKYYQFQRPVSTPLTVQKPYPPFYLGGSSPIAKRVAVEYADTFLMWGEPHAWIQEQIKEIESIRAEYRAEKGIDRPLRYGLRAQVLVRDTEEEAWAAAWELISKVSPEAIEQAQRQFAQTDATNQRRQNELREQSRNDRFVVGPNLWTGLSLVRSGGAILIVGTAEQVTDRLLEYAELGVSTFILSGYPHLEEAEIFGREALPLFRKKWAQKQQS